MSLTKLLNIRTFNSFAFDVIYIYYILLSTFEIVFDVFLCVK